MNEKEMLELLLDKVTGLDSKISSLESQIKDINLHLENVTDKNIRIIAEGHIDLSRKLNQIIHTTSDIKAYHELQSILVSEHEDKIKQII